MKRHFSKFLLLSFLISLAIGCTQHTMDDVIEEEVIIELVTYQDVKSTFNTICTACHSNPTQNGAPMPLVNYQNVKEAIMNMGLLDRISRNDGEDGLMPFGGPRLPQQTIDKIFQWNADGLLEN